MEGVGRRGVGLDEMETRMGLEVRKLGHPGRKRNGVGYDRNICIHCVCCLVLRRLCEPVRDLRSPIVQRVLKAMETELVRLHAFSKPVLVCILCGR